MFRWSEQPSWSLPCVPSASVSMVRVAWGLLFIVRVRLLTSFGGLSSERAVWDLFSVETTVGFHGRHFSVSRRCHDCGAILEEYDEETLGLAIVVLSTFIHLSPDLAAPLLLDIMQSVGR